MSSNATLELAMRDEPQAVMLSNAQINVIANTEFVPKSMRGQVPKVLACIARGRAMGIPDMVALNGIDIIEGKATLSAELMVALVRDHGHSITGDVTATGAVVRGKRRDNGDTMSAEFNREMAEAAGLLNKANYKKHPDDMYWARAVSKLCRRLFADCFAGGTYTPEDFVGDDGPTADETHDGDWEQELETAERPDPTEELIAADVWIADLKKRAAAAKIDSGTIATTWTELRGEAIPSETPITQAELDQLWDQVQERAASNKDDETA